VSKTIQINFHPDDKTLRQFGWIALAGFGFVAAIAWFEVLVFAFGLGAARPWVAGACGGLGCAAALFSLVHPRANRPIYVGLSVLTYPIGFVLSYLIMGTLFFGIIAPVGILFKVIGRDPMGRRYEAETESYWSDARPARRKERYFRQF
jgi:hypothetical protein